jgi:prepilin-type N-terminal cleavage/methylation domain-containing protein/prepilin-type processing-associated H-X9-DG protein
MKRAQFLLYRRRLAFSLVELMVVIAIIALMAGLGMPAYERAIATARSAKCASNLRAIGVALTQAATDNNNEYPPIQEAGGPVYPPTVPAQSLINTLSPYGLTSNDLQCPTDMGSSPSAFAQYGSSYEWNPAFDDEVTVTPIIYLNAQIQIPVNSARVHLCYDFNAIHNGRPNTLYGDGHVRSH